MQTTVNSVPKTTKGNHPNVKVPARKAIRNASKSIAKEAGQTVAQKTVWGYIKKALKAIF